MPPQRRETKFVLVKWVECKLGPCKDVVHQDNIMADQNYPAIEEGQTRIILCGKRNIHRKGKILKRGSERALKLLRVRPDGSLGDVGPCIPTRRECEHFHALSTRRAEAEALADADAYDTILDHNASWDAPNVQGEMLKPDEGTLSARVFSVEEVTALARALPPNPTTEQVREVLWSLPCLRQQDPQNERALVPGIKCYVNTHVLSTLHRQYKDKKNLGLYMGALLRTLVPERVLAVPHLTARGMCKPGSVGLPKPIYEAIKVYMEHRMQPPKNGWANAINSIINVCRTKLLTQRLSSATEASIRRQNDRLQSETQEVQEQNVGLQNLQQPLQENLDQIMGHMNLQQGDLQEQQQEQEQDTFAALLAQSIMT
ncbi:hypothetical protein KUF71_003340 [Frankliniella fusca]|uniref:BEN domain-containing protein n=1 Tax=Frankliniella fusca TaxID=407009 RepID=A0AAE1GTA8_9NEOP|nr:hypothetical protein KUF71_003340 [Frankliniella fusca]